MRMRTRKLSRSCEAMPDGLENDRLHAVRQGSLTLFSMTLGDELNEVHGQQRKLCLALIMGALI